MYMMDDLKILEAFKKWLCDLVEQAQASLKISEAQNAQLKEELDDAIVDAVSYGLLRPGLERIRAMIPEDCNYVILSEWAADRIAALEAERDQRPANGTYAQHIRSLEAENARLTVENGELRANFARAVRRADHATSAFRIANQKRHHWIARANDLATQRNSWQSGFRAMQEERNARECERDHEHQNAEFWRDQLRQVEAALLKVVPERPAGVDLVTWAEQIAASINRLHEYRCEAMNELNQRNHELDDARAEVARLRGALEQIGDHVLSVMRLQPRTEQWKWNEVRRKILDALNTTAHISLPRTAGVQAEFGEDGES